MQIGLSYEEWQAEAWLRMAALDDAQEGAEHLGPDRDLLRFVALTAFQCAADLIITHNERIAAQLAATAIE